MSSITSHTAPTSNSNKSPDELLMQYSEAGNIAEVVRYIESGANVNYEGLAGATPLHDASRCGNLEVVDVLLKKGAWIGPSDVGGSQPLHLACANGHEAVAQLLIQKGADVSAETKSGTTPLHRASLSGHVNVMRLLVINGADVLAEDVHGVTPYDIALRKGWGKTVHEWLREYRELKYGPLDDDSSPSPSQPVGHLPNADAPSQKSKSDDPPPSAPANYYTLSIVGDGSSIRQMENLNREQSILIRAHSVNRRLWRTVRKQVGEEETDRIRSVFGTPRTRLVVVTHSGRLFRQESSGSSHFSCVVGDVERQSVLEDVQQDMTDALASLLHLLRSNNVSRERSYQVLNKIQQQVLIHWRSEEAQASCLHIAARKGHLHLCQALVDKLGQQYILEKDVDGRTPLHLSAEADNADVTQLLCELLPEAAWATNSNGRTPLHDAAQSGANRSLEVLCQFLCDAKRDIDAKDAEGCTPLVLAVKQLRALTTATLLRYGANGSACDSAGCSCLRLAKGRGRGSTDATQVARLLSDSIRKAHEINWKSREEAAFKSWVDGDKDRHQCVQSILAQPLREVSLAEETAQWVDLFDAVRRRQCAITDTALFRSTLPVNTPCHILLYRALAFAAADSVCDSQDVLDALRQFERVSVSVSAISETVSSPHLHRLYFLAAARWAERAHENHDLVVVLLRRFVELVDQQTVQEWLEMQEMQFLERKWDLDRELDDEVCSHEANYDKVEHEWMLLKENLQSAQLQAMEELMTMVGLDSVKRKAMDIFIDVLADQQLKDSGYQRAVAAKSLNFTFLGNPGTGKTTVARLFARLLGDAKARAGHKFVSMTAHEALRMGSSKFASSIASLTGATSSIGPPPSTIRIGMRVEVRDRSDGLWYPATILHAPDGALGPRDYSVVFTDNTELRGVNRSNIRPIGSAEASGGVLFIDEAYDLDPASNGEGRAILAEIMSVAEEHRDKVTIILAGYKDDIEKSLFAFNPGMTSRFTEVMFDDYTENELVQIWRLLCKDRQWTCTDEVSIVAGRWVSRHAGSKGFGNARSIRNLFDSAVSQAKRRYLLSSKRQEEQETVDSGEAAVPRIDVVDVIGKEPSRHNIPALDEALKELDGMIGVKKVKRALYSMVELARSNYRKQLRGERADEVSLNRLFLGNAGTGKTTVAKLYGRILIALRLLSNGDVIYATASDLIGQHLGETEQKTKNLISAARGKVLVIDEAYNLDDESYGRKALNTLVERVSGSPGDDIAVILAGYEEHMRTMLRNQNPGLARRFDINRAFHFEDFDDNELLQILSAECNRSGVRCPLRVKFHAVQVLSRRRLLPNFGNAGAVVTLFHDAKQKMASRIHHDLCDAAGPGENVAQLIEADFDGSAADPIGATSQTELFDDGDDDDHENNDCFKSQFTSIGARIRVRRREGRSIADVVGHFIFCGPAGTGKRSAARTLARVLHGHGITATDRMYTTSGEDLLGQYAGETKVVVEEKVAAAQGAVLYIAQAAAMSRGMYGTEAIGKLVSMLYNTQSHVILSGERDEMEELLRHHPGLRGHFNETVHFKEWSVAKCVRLVMERLAKNGLMRYEWQEPATAYEMLTRAFGALKTRPGWSNARDAVRMFRTIEKYRELRCGGVSSDDAIMTISSKQLLLSDIRKAVQELERNRPFAKATGCQSLTYDHINALQQHRRTRDAPMLKENALPLQKTAERVIQHEEQEKKKVKCKEAIEATSEDGSTCDHIKELLNQRIQQLEAILRSAQFSSTEEEVREAAGIDEELSRLQALRDRASRSGLCSAKEQGKFHSELQLALEEERERVQTCEALRRLGRCPAGYVWHCRGDFWQCGGGTHRVSTAELSAQSHQ